MEDLPDDLQQATPNRNPNPDPGPNPNPEQAIAAISDGNQGNHFEVKP
jgi:hypothetical protein